MLLLACLLVVVIFPPGRQQGDAGKQESSKWQCNQQPIKHLPVCLPACLTACCLTACLLACLLASCRPACLLACMPACFPTCLLAYPILQACLHAWLSLSGLGCDECGVQAALRVLTGGKVKAMTVKLAQPVRLIPVHTKGRPPSYFIIAGLVFGQASVLRSAPQANAFLRNFRPHPLTIFFLPSSPHLSCYFFNVHTQVDC